MPDSSSLSETLTESRTPAKIELVCAQHSRIYKVNLYPGRAEVTRKFKFSVIKGFNTVVIRGFPRTLDVNSVQFTGRGHASINDVHISSVYGTGEGLNECRRGRDAAKKALHAATEARTALSNSISHLKFQDIPAERLNAVFNDYLSVSAGLDDKLLELKEEVTMRESAHQAIQDETHRMEYMATINVYASEDDRISFLVTYAVSPANWSPTYDIRLDTTSKDTHSVTITYKAKIVQSSGENWENVPLTLQTVKPSFGMSLPGLTSWNVFEATPMPVMVPTTSVAPAVVMYSRSRSRSRRSRSSSPRRRRSPRRRSSSGSERFAPPVIIQAPLADIVDSGSSPMVFSIPGDVTIPSDGDTHAFSIGRFELPATLVRFVLPRLDPRVQLKTKITNSTEYVFLSGPSNIYVDGSFVGTSRLQRVNPNQSFDFPMGFDTTINVTCHPREENTSSSGLVQKQTTRTLKQRVTVQNTRHKKIDNLRIIDQIPVSKSDKIEVKLHSPPLDTKNREPKAVAAGPNIMVRWDKAGEDGEGDNDTLGPGQHAAEGQFSWTISIPAKKTLTLLTHFDLVSPRNVKLGGV